MGILKLVFGPKLELRPHHVLGFAANEAYPEWYEMSEREYIKNFRAQKGDFHSDNVILCQREIMRKMHNNPNLKFRYVSGLDSICRVCEHGKDCSAYEHVNRKIVEREDEHAKKLLPELKFRKTYRIKYLLKLFKKKGMLEREFWSK